MSGVIITLSPDSSPAVSLLLLNRWRGGCFGWLRLGSLRLDPLQYRARSAMPAGIHRQCDGGDHERYRRPGGGPGQRAGCASRPKCRLAALAAKGGGEITAGAALQQHHNDDEKTNQTVDRNDQTVNHK